MNKHTKITDTLSLNFHTQFKCIGSDCSATCCSGWRITLDKATYKSYKSSPELAPFVRKFHDKKLSRTSENFGSIKLRGNGDCPYLDENLLCKVQLKFGEEALSKTCSSFPRIHGANGTTVTEHLSLGCPEVVKLLFNEKTLALQITNATNSVGSLPKSDMSAIMSAMIQFIEIDPAPTWQKLIAIQTSLIELKKHSLYKKTELVHIFEQRLRLINGESLDDPSMFQVQTLFPSIERLSIDVHRNSLTEIRQNAMLYLTKYGSSYESKVKLFVVSRELFKRAADREEAKILDRIAINELYKNYHEFTSDPRDIVNIFTNVAITCAMIKFIIICNFGYDNFVIQKTKLNRTISLMYRTLVHIPEVLSNIKMQLDEQYKDSNIASALLLA